MGTYLLSGFADEASKELKQQIEALKRNDMKYLEIRNIGDKGAMYYSLEEIEGFAKTLEDAGIKVGSIGSGIGKISITDDFAPHYEWMQKHMEACRIFGTKHIRIFSYYIPEEEDPYKYKDEVFRRMEKIADLAYKNGVCCCHENEANIYGESAERCLEMLEAFPDTLKGIFDPANFIITGHDVSKAYELLDGKLEYLHIKDALKDTKQIVPAGEGDGCIPEILKDFSKIEGAHFLTLEPHLAVFDGLQNLQRDELKHKYTFASNDEAFDFAVQALKGILDREGLKYE